MGKNKRIILLKTITLKMLIFLSVVLLFVGAYFTFKLEYNISNYRDSLQIDYIYDTNAGVYKKIDEEIEQISKSEYEKEISTFLNYIDHAPLIFPQTVNKEKCDFLCYTQKISGVVFDYRVQLYLKNDFIENSEYLKEIDRLKSMKVNKYSDNKLIYFDDLFMFPTYVAIYNYYSAFEFAVCDFSNKTIYYVFLYDVGLRNMKIPSFLIPFKLLKDTSYKSEKKYINVYDTVYYR